jgi:hypothetical protein
VGCDCLLAGGGDVCVGWWIVCTWMTNDGFLKIGSFQEDEDELGSSSACKCV